MQLFATITTALALGIAAEATRCQAATPSPVPAFEVEMRINTLARGLDVRIGELADISPASADALAIGALRFGPAPIPGYPRTVTRSELLQTLVAAGHAAGNFRFKGAIETVVQTVAIEIAPATLTDAAQTVLEAVLAQEGEDVEFEPGGRVRSLQIQPGRRSQDLRARVRGGATNPNSAVIDVDVLVDGEVAKTVPVQFKLTRYRPVLKINGTVRAGTPLDASLVTVAREPMAQATGLYLNGLEQVSGMVARRNLQPGQLLTISDVAAPALIHRGEVVTVVVTRGRVKVTVRAIANGDAALGETITVTNIQSRAQITGVAAASGTVVVPAN